MQSIALYQAMLCFTVAIYVDVIAPPVSLLQYHVQYEEVVLITLSSIAAVAVNLSSMALIGKTSAVTFQVVGHGKTILILMFGFLFYPSTASTQDVVLQLVGVAAALLGVFVYSYLKLSPAQ